MSRQHPPMDITKLSVPRYDLGDVPLPLELEGAPEKIISMWRRDLEVFVSLPFGQEVALGCAIRAWMRSVGKEVADACGIPSTCSYVLMVLEGMYQGKHLRFCLSGYFLGAFTLIGAAALDALLRSLPEDAPVLFEDMSGRTWKDKEIRRCVRGALEAAPDGAGIVFMGDMIEELDGRILPVLDMLCEPVVDPKE